MTARSVVAWLKKNIAHTGHLCLDSRQLTLGDVFFACPGAQTDGRLYIQQAIQHGAAAVVMQAGAQQADPISVPFKVVENLPGLLGEIADLWYGRPSAALSVVAITGTNGKTTTVQWLAAALNEQGVPCGTIGTLGVIRPDGSNLGAALTTPDVLTMHRSLAAMRQSGATVVALEASSIGISQGRLDHVRIEIAGFTNLTLDHLDYHKTLRAYKAAKFELFKWATLRAAVINVDDPAGAELFESTRSLGAVGFSLRGNGVAALQADDIQAGTYGLVFNLTTPRGAAQIVTRLVGEHNISNLLLVAGVLRQLGWSVARTARSLAMLRSVPGRLQIIEPLLCGDGPAAQPLVLVDYAHTPDALEHVLAALREVVSARGGRLICVFGCGGSRDRSKRPIMGRIAMDLADSVILTNDNPRAEHPQTIVDEIVADLPVTPVIVLDRAQAIMGAIWRAQSSDVVLIAGKGHETYQESKGERTPFDDREWARLALTWQRGLTVSIDTRSIQPGQLFIALKGDRFDGHQYLEQARVAGACAAVVEHCDQAVSLPQFALGPTDAALITMGHAWRRNFQLPVIAVTGSNGKTTTKEMIASILKAWSGAEASLSTAGNLNNSIGVPLTLLRLKKAHRAAVLELGMNHPGEIAVLAEMALPTVALVNNAQREHQEFMHSVDAVAKENGAVLSALPVDGVAVFPGDDAYTALWLEMAGSRKNVVFGFESRFDVHADQIGAESTRTTCLLHTPSGSARLTLAAAGLHNLRNAMAAAACAVAAGIPLAAIVQGLSDFSPVSGRLQAHALRDGWQLIDDTYNANPDSVRAAIDVLARLEGKKVLVLGDMAEVGSDSPAMHAEVGAYAKECAIDELMTLGSAAKGSGAAFGAMAQSFDSVDALLAGLIERMPAHILVKGSRSMRMERVVQGLQQWVSDEREGARHAT